MPKNIMSSAAAKAKLVVDASIDPEMEKELTEKILDRPSAMPMLFRARLMSELMAVFATLMTALAAVKPALTTSAATLPSALQGSFKELGMSSCEHGLSMPLTNLLMSLVSVSSFSEAS